MFFPMIVTNAPLFICDFSYEEVDLKQGVLPSEDMAFKEVPFIQFKKTFLTYPYVGAPPASIESANFQAQRTVFVLHAPMLAWF